jgi:tetratricopeptide (TPR) repeat protein
VHDRIDRAEAKLAGVDLDGAQAELVGVVDDAEATEHAPTLARALRTRGALEMARRDLDGAHGDLRRAFRLALGSGDDLGALQAAHGLVGYHSKVAREPDAVLVWVDLVESLATRVGGHPAHEADALDAAGLAHRELGDMPAAVAHGERAAAGWAAIDEGGPDHARTLVNLGGSYYFDGAPERGVQTLERATEMLIDALGSAHPDVAQAQQNLAAVLSITDQARAREVLTSALNAFEATYGADTGHTADVHHNLASLAFGEGDIEAARAHIKRSIAIHRAELGEDHRAVADGLIASTHYWIDEQPEVAADAAREALAIYAKALPADAPDWMQIRLRAGAAIFVGGDRPRGLALARQAIDDLDAHPGRNRIADWIDVAKYAWMLELDGQLPQALQWRARAVELLEARPEIPPGNLAAQKAAMARILWRIGEDGSRGRARTLAREARALFDEHGEDRVGQRKDLDAWLAETGALR